MPFLDSGYGPDLDAWRVAATARTWSTTGTYIASRLPGYPIHEFGFSLVWQWDPLATNALTAAFSLLAAIFFAMMLRRLGCRDYFVASLALAFVQVVFLNSTVTMDYV